MVLNVMELSDSKRLVFNAARDNNLAQLKVHLNGKSQDEINMLLTRRFSGATPLVIACKNGNYDIVEYLVSKCHANIEQVGSVTFDGEIVEDAPPLWCAAAAGHVSVVKFLVKYGANVNSTTKTNSTPLRAACFDGHFEIVKYLINNGADFEVANRHGHTCLMIACYKGHYKIAQYLLSLKADVNRRSVKGNTALHDCAESGSLEILQLLLRHGAKMDVDSYGMTPLLAASVTGHLQIVEHLISLPTVKREDKIAALELLGATYVDKKRDMLSALKLWKRAMEERYNIEPQIPKIVNEPIAAYDYAVEVTNIDALDEIVMDPDQMRMQALVIRERILGPAHPDTSYYIRFRGAHYADAGRFDRCIELWTYAVTMQQSILEPLNSMTQSSFLSFAELFSFMLGEAGRPITRGRVIPPIETIDMLIIFRKAVREVELGQKMFESLPELEKDPDALSRALVSALHLGCLLARLVVDDNIDSASSSSSSSSSSTSAAATAAASSSSARTLNQITDKNNDSTTDNDNNNYDDDNDYDYDYNDNDDEDCINVYSNSNTNNNSYTNMRRKILQALYELIKLKVVTGFGYTALHLVCDRDAALVGRCPACQFPSPQLAKALLMVGADPNKKDVAGNTPLHLAALAKPCPSSLAKTLLDYGAHLDAKNADGETFESLLTSRNQNLHELVNPIKYTKLSCLAARVIQKHQIKYVNHVPVSLYEFIEEH